MNQYHEELERELAALREDNRGLHQDLAEAISSNDQLKAHNADLVKQVEDVVAQTNRLDSRLITSKQEYQDLHRDWLSQREIIEALQAQNRVYAQRIDAHFIPEARLF